MLASNRDISFSLYPPWPPLRVKIPIDRYSHKEFQEDQEAARSLTFVSRLMKLHIKFFFNRLLFNTIRRENSCGSARSPTQLQPRELTTPSIDRSIVTFSGAR